MGDEVPAPDYDWPDILATKHKTVLDSIEAFVFGHPLHQSTPHHEDQVNNQELLAARLLETRRQMQEELDNSRIEAARKEEEIKQKAKKAEQELVAQIVAANGPPPLIKPPQVPGQKRSYGVMAVQPLATPTKAAALIKPIDSWIFEPFPDPAPNADVNTALILMATLQKSSGDLFKGDPKQWPIFIQTVKSMVHDITPFNSQRISLLRSMLHADLQATFAQILSSPLTYQQALQDLWHWYGRPHLVIREYIKDLRSIAALKDGDIVALGNFQQRIHGAICSLQASGYGHELQSSVALADLVEKLPRQLASRWGKHVHKLVVKNSASAFTGPDLHTFDAWLADTVI